MPREPSAADARAHVRNVVVNPDEWMELSANDVPFEFPYGEAVGVTNTT